MGGGSSKRSFASSSVEDNANILLDIGREWENDLDGIYNVSRDGNKIIYEMPSTSDKNEIAEKEEELKELLQREYEDFDVIKPRYSQTQKYWRMIIDLDQLQKQRKWKAEKQQRQRLAKQRQQQQQAQRLKSAAFMFQTAQKKSEQEQLLKKTIQELNRRQAQKEIDQWAKEYAAKKRAAV